jgi:transcriptional regulator with XRE-family HTH domain
MSVIVDADRLRYELRLRGLSPHNLARATGLSDATVSAALHGRAIAEISLKLIADFLERTPVSEFMRKLIGPYAPPSADDDARQGRRSQQEG